MPLDTYDCLVLSIENNVARLHLNRPELLNRFDRALHTEFPRALRELAGMQDVAALIVSAEGRAFSAGGDIAMIKEANADKSIRNILAREALDIINGILELPFPLICAAHGPAIGLGATILSLCDIVVASRDAKIADPHVVLGLVAGDGGIVGWAQSIGVNRAKRFLYTGDPITGEQAYEFGLVTDLVDEPGDVLPAAKAIAAKIASLPRGSVRGTKKSFGRLTQDVGSAVFELSLAYEMETLGEPEIIEAISKISK